MSTPMQTAATAADTAVAAFISAVNAYMGAIETACSAYYLAHGQSNPRLQTGGTQIIQQLANDAVTNRALLLPAKSVSSMTLAQIHAAD
jgi:hypothetical protein